MVLPCNSCLPSGQGYRRLSVDTVAGISDRETRHLKYNVHVALDHELAKT